MPPPGFTGGGTVATVSFGIMNDTQNPTLPEGRYLVRNVGSGLLLEVYGNA